MTANSNLDDPSPIALRARWLLPITSPPIENGIITIAGERIVAVGENASSQPPRDLGDVVLVPGLVNAHTHLEFSDLETPLGSPGEPLPKWIRHVIETRRGRATDVAECRTRGLNESLAVGVTTIGEIATTPWPSSAYPCPDVTVFFELIALAAERIDSRIAAADEHLHGDWHVDRLRPGLSPHAPYTVHPRLVRRLAELSAVHRVPLAMHLAESRDELELLRTATGPFRELLDSLDAWSPDAIPLGTRPLDYLQLLANADRALVIHGNYLAGEEIEFLAARRERMSVVYCPRTHRYFRHDPYPLARLLAFGVSVALGTDSRASNPDLDLLGEVRFLAGQQSAVPPEKLLELATLGGARALGLAHTVGSLEPGKLANFAMVALERDQCIRPYEAIVDSNAPVRETWWRGRPVDRRGERSG